MKVCLFGCKSTTLIVARHLKSAFGLDTIVTIDTEKGTAAEVADYTDVRPWSQAQNVKVLQAKRYDLKSDDDLSFFEGERFDVGFVMGWQRLVPSEILNTFSSGVYGMHGSAADLPKGRGRSPMNWAILEGRSLFYTNLFKYDPGVDSGNVVDTMAFSIGSQDTAETMHYKNTLAMIGLLYRNAEAFRSGGVTATPQSDATPTYYPKRAPEDSLIDWTQPIDMVERFIRAVAPPFNGAFTFRGSDKVRIVRAAIFEMDYVPYGYADRMIGEVVEVFPSGKILIKCSGGLLIAHECTMEGDAKPIELGDRLTDDTHQRRIFSRNSHGTHDLTEH